jgi:hypothetical protein
MRAASSKDASRAEIHGWAPSFYVLRRSERRLTDAILPAPLSLQSSFASATLVKSVSIVALHAKMLLRHGFEDGAARDRRTMRRFNMNLPASVRVAGIPAPFETESENISARGIFFYIDRWMKEGSPVEVTMDFPSQLTMADPVRVRFNARIVRVIESENPMRVGVAAAIEAYDFVQPEGTEQSTLSSQHSALQVRG